MSSRLARSLLSPSLRGHQTPVKSVSSIRRITRVASASYSRSNVRTVIPILPEEVRVPGHSQIRRFSEKPASHSRIEGLVTEKPLVVFMKGMYTVGSR